MQNDDKENAPVENAATTTVVAVPEKQPQQLDAKPSPSLSSRFSSLITKSKNNAKILSQESHSMKNMEEKVVSALSAKIKELEQALAKETEQIAKLQHENSKLKSLNSRTQEQRNKCLHAMQAQIAALKEEHAKLQQGQMIASFRNEMLQFAQQMQQSYVKEMTSLNARLQTEQQEKRKLFNIIQDLKGNIRVYVRIRPFKDAPAAVTVPSNEEIAVQNKTYQFEKIFGMEAKNADVYSNTKEYVSWAWLLIGL